MPVVRRHLSLLGLLLVLASHAAASETLERGSAEDRLDWYGRTGVFRVRASAVRTIRLLEARLAADPDNPIVLGQLAKRQLTLALRTREHEDAHAAEASYRQLARLQPGSTSAWIGLGRALHERHRFDEALGVARRAAEIDPQAAPVLALLCDIHFAMGHYAEAEAIAAQLGRTPSLSTLAREAQLRAVRGRVDEARTLLRHAIERGRSEGASARDLAQLHFLLGELAREHDHPDEARGAFRNALERDPDNDAARVGLAKVDAAAGRTQDAIGALTTLAEKSPQPTHWIALAQALERAGRAREAETWWMHTQSDFEADLAVGDVGHLREYALLLIERGRAEAAVAPALRDLDEVRRDLGALETAAWALHSAGRSEEALAPMGAALRIGSRRSALVLRAAAIRAAAAAR